MIKTALTAASIALVATAAPAIAGPLDAPTQKVSFADLDLSTPEGQAALDRRIDAAARDVCHLDDMPFGGGGDIAWAPDGSGVYFVARESGYDEPYSTDLDIYFSDLSGNAPVNLTAANEATDANPAPSPDGRYLAFLAMKRPGYESDRLVVNLMDVETGRTRALTEEFDRSFGNLAWSADGSSLLATAYDVLDTPAFRIDPESGAVTRLDLMAGNEAHIGNMTPLPGDRLLFTRDSIGAPHDSWILPQPKPRTQAAISN